MPLLDTLYDAYSFNAIPVLGGLVAGDSASYRYLVESIRRFPDQKSFMRHDRECRLRARALPQSHRRHRRDPLRLATMMRPDYERDRQHGATDQGRRRHRLVGRARACPTMRTCRRRSLCSAA